MINSSINATGVPATRQMKNFFLRLLLPILVCGVSSCSGQQNAGTDPEKNYLSIEAKQLQTDVRGDTAIHARRTDMLGVDFRFAARIVTPGVVHVNSTWKTIDDQRDLRDDDTYRHFFDDDFWNRFFEPFRQQGPRQASASGVIVTSDGYIITNNHVIDGADEIDVVLHDQRIYSAKLVGSDSKTDIALLKIDESNLSFIAFGNSDDVEVGEWVLAVGNPFNLASTVTAGIVSAKARNINILRDREAVESFIQTDAAVNPGNSGGALVNLEGKLIGINSAIATPTGVYAGYSFAIPINIVKKVADDLLTFGSVQRGYLGVIIRDMTGSLAKSRNLKFTPGVYVDSLIRGGAAMEAGIKSGDIITQIDNVSIETSPQLQEMVAKHRPGEKLRVTFMRDGNEKQVNITLKGPETTSTPGVRKSEKAMLDVLGIDVEEISAKEKTQYNVENGLKVTGIRQGKIREFTKMKEGFIITKIDNDAVRAKGDVDRILRNKKGSIVIEGFYPGSPTIIYYGFGI